MGKHFAPLDRRNWLKVAEWRKAYKEHKMSHAEYVFMRDIVLERGSLTNNAQNFSSYFLGIMSKEKDGTITDEYIAKLLENAKKNADKRLKMISTPEVDTFQGIPVIWESFRTYDEAYNSYDGYTQKTVLPWKLSKEEQRDFEERYWIEFHDPYCDGRDCTGAPFTSWMKFLRCSDRTVVIHNVSLDL